MKPYSILVAAAILLVSSMQQASAEPNLCDQRKDIGWQSIEGQASSFVTTMRRCVPNGWLVRVDGPRGSSITFVADADHHWQPTLFQPFQIARAGHFLMLQDGRAPQSATPPGQRLVCPCIDIDVNQIVALEPQKPGMAGRTIVHTTSGDYVVWQDHDEIIALSGP